MRARVLASGVSSARVLVVTGWMVAATTGTLPGCEGGPAPPPPDVAMMPPDLSMMVIPDLALPPPAFCGPTTCQPPACCGAKCTGDAECCFGTSCLNSRCTPPGCGGCGEVGCAIDFVACTARCAQPACCLAACKNDGDCCPGLRCAVDVNQQSRCMPKSCDACSGFRALCDVGPGCGISCKPPRSCGKVCAVDADCGTGNQCRTFVDGRKLCVPALFTATCNACGLMGCLFHPDSCDVECPPAPMADGGMVPPDLAAADAPLGDGGLTDGAVGDLLAAPSPDLATPDSGNFAPGCTSCCGVCTKDAECCGTMKCRSDGKARMICTPAECLRCVYGCRFTCP